MLRLPHYNHSSQPYKQGLALSRVTNLVICGPTATVKVSTAFTGVGRGVAGMKASSFILNGKVQQ